MAKLPQLWATAKVSEPTAPPASKEEAVRPSQTAKGSSRYKARDQNLGSNTCLRIS